MAKETIETIYNRLSRLTARLERIAICRTRADEAGNKDLVKEYDSEEKRRNLEGAYLSSKLEPMLKDAGMTLDDLQAASPRGLTDSETE